MFSFLRPYAIVQGFMYSNPIARRPPPQRDGAMVLKRSVSAMSLGTIASSGRLIGVGEAPSINPFPGSFSGRSASASEGSSATARSVTLSSRPTSSVTALAMEGSGVIDSTVESLRVSARGSGNLLRRSVSERPHSTDAFRSII